MFDNLQKTLSITKSLSDHLQAEQVDMSLAADLVNSTSETLTELRSDTVWDPTYKYKEVAELHDIEDFIPARHSSRRRQTPRHLEDSITTESTGHRESLNTSHTFKTTIYYRLAELNCRFSQLNCEHMKALQACCPLSSNFLDTTSLTPLATFYGLDVALLTNECPLANSIGRQRNSVYIRCI